MSEWRPVESAPPDVPLLLYCPDRGPTNPERVEATEFRNTRAGTQHAWATHWMPIPAGPPDERRLAKSRGILIEYPWQSVTQEQANAVLLAMRTAGMLGADEWDPS